MTEIILKSTIDVQYIDHMGSDQRIVEAMLVSTKGLNAAESATESVRGRLNFLIEKRHGTPFECGSLTVRVHAPIKVWREWHRHRIGWSYSEESGRYKSLEPVFWLPPPDRPMIRPDFFKSSAPVFHMADVKTYNEMVDRLKDCYTYTYSQYLKLLDLGIDRGLARDVLGVGIFSTCYCTCNPRSLMHFLELRTNRIDARRPSKPLWEIETAALQLEEIFAQHWPITYELWNKHGRAAP